MEKDKEMLCAAEEKHDDSVAGKAPERSHLVLKRTIGIILVAAFFGIMILLAVYVGAPLIEAIFGGEGDAASTFQKIVDDNPVSGRLIYVGVQILQVFIAFIPGEVVQLAAGLMYGPWLGAAIILIGCVISSAIIYKLVHALGAPFVQSMVSTEHLEKFRSFEKSGKLDIVVFILFLIPGMPKDVFTYIVPLTNMPYKKFIVLTTIGRIPGVVGSTYAAAGFASGEVVGPIVVLVVLAVIAVVAIVFRDKIMGAFHRGEDK